MRSVFLGLCLLGATCSDESPTPEAPSLAETAPGDVEATETTPDTSDGTDAPESATEDETVLPAKDGHRPDTGIEQIGQRVDRQIDEADEVINMLSKDAN